MEFEAGVVRAEIMVPDAGVARWENSGGLACEGCVDFLSRHPRAAGRLPTLEEVRRLEERWGVPQYANVAVLELAEAAWDR